MTALNSIMFRFRTMEMVKKIVCSVFQFFSKQNSCSGTANQNNNAQF